MATLFVLHTPACHWLTWIFFRSLQAKGDVNTFVTWNNFHYNAVFLYLTLCYYLNVLKMFFFPK